jgi:hypothetical protein
MLWWSIHCDAVSKVENEWTPAQSSEDTRRFSSKLPATDDEKLRVEITLDASDGSFLDVLRCPGRGHRFIKADGVYGRRHGVPIIQKTSPTREPDDRHSRITAPQSLGDYPNRLNTPPMKERLRKYTGPTIEKLNRLSTRRDLTL